MSVKRVFNDRAQFFDSNGDPLNGGKLFIYLAGSTTKQTTYTDSAGATPGTNPRVLDSAGRLQAELWVTTGLSYKLVLTTSADSDPPVSPIWTEDNISGVNDSTSVLDQWQAGPTPTFVSTTSFTLVGNQTATFTVGRRLKSTNSGGTIYSTITASAFGAVTTVTVENDSGVLDSGLSAVSYGLISPENTSSPTFRDNTFRLADDSDPTKRLDFQLSGITTATKRTLTVQNTSGSIQLVGGKQAIPFGAASMQPRRTSGCAAMTFTNGAADQPDIPYLAFDGAAKEYAALPPFRLPNSYNSGTITASFEWRRASGTGAANVIWGIRAVTVADDATPAVAFGSDATVTDAASTTTVNFMMSGESSACTIAGTPAPGKLVFIEAFRDGAAGGDTLNAVDAWLTSCTIFLTTSAQDDA